MGIEGPVAGFSVDESADRHLHLLFFHPPLAHLAFPEVLRDLAVELVRVGSIHPVADTGQARVQAGPFGTDLADSLPLVFAERGDDLGHDLRRYLETLQRFAQSIGDVFLPEPGKFALPVIAAAAIVDVLLFLNVAGQHAAVVTAIHQSPESNVPLRILGTVVTGEYILYGRKSLRVYEQWMRPWKDLANPVEETDVKAILQNQMNIAPAHCLAEIGFEHTAEGGERVGTGGIQVHHPTDHRRVVEVDLDGSVGLVVAVAKRCVAGKDALRGLLAHTFLDLLAEVI